MSLHHVSFSTFFIVYYFDALVKGPRILVSPRAPKISGPALHGDEGKLLTEQPVEQVHGGRSHGDEEKTPGGTRTQGKGRETIQEVRTSLKRLDARLCCGWSYGLLGTQLGWTGAVLFADVAYPIQLSYTPPLAGMWNRARNTGRGA